MVWIDISCDISDEDDAGLVSGSLDGAADPSRITPGAIVLAGDAEASAVAEVVDLVDQPEGTLVHLRPLTAG